MMMSVIFNPIENMGDLMHFHVQVEPMRSSMKNEHVIPFLNAQIELFLHFLPIISAFPLSSSHVPTVVVVFIAMCI